MALRRCRLPSTRIECGDGRRSVVARWIRSWPWPTPPIYLEAVGHVVLAWIWLSQVQAAAGNDGAFYDGKRAAAAYFFHFELPKTGPMFDLLASLDRTTLDLSPSSF